MPGQHGGPGGVPAPPGGEAAPLRPGQAFGLGPQYYDLRQRVVRSRDSTGRPRHRLRADARRMLLSGGGDEAAERGAGAGVPCGKGETARGTQALHAAAHPPQHAPGIWLPSVAAAHRPGHHHPLRQGGDALRGCRISQRRVHRDRRTRCSPSCPEAQHQQPGEILQV